ncbi:reverse transcriptase domain-containing protein [Tanacetum coccineum]
MSNVPKYFPLAYKDRLLDLFNQEVGEDVAKVRECRGVVCGLKIVMRRREEYIRELKALGDCDGVVETVRFMEGLQADDMDMYDHSLLLMKEMEAKARDKSRFILKLNGYVVSQWKGVIPFAKRDKLSPRPGVHMETRRLLQEQVSAFFLEQEEGEYEESNTRAALPWCLEIFLARPKTRLTSDLIALTEKCHFMVKEGIVLGHKVSEAGLEVDKAKIYVISKHPPPTNVKGIRSFLGHVGFYRRFIKDFLKIARPLTKLLEKDTPFECNDECHKAFDSLKEKLTCNPVIVSPNWNLPFELMCDVSEFTVGAVLGQKDEFDIEIKDKKGIDNVAADHLSRIENDETSDNSDVDDNFPGETLMEITTRDIPWFTNFANYLVGDIILRG